jgi:hypothetical protein
VRDLVSDYQGAAAAAGGGGCGFVEEQRGIAVEDGAGIFHSAPLVIRDGQHVELLEGIVDAEPLVVEVDRLLCGLERELALFLLFRHRADTHRNGIDRGAQAIPIADGERHEISGHLRAGGELKRVTAVRGGFVGNDSAIGDRGVGFVQFHRQIECGLE